MLQQVWETGNEVEEGSGPYLRPMGGEADEC